MMTEGEDVVHTRHRAATPSICPYMYLLSGRTGEEVLPGWVFLRIAIFLGNGGCTHDARSMASSRYDDVLYRSSASSRY